MNLNSVQQTLVDMDVLYRTTIELYEEYFRLLEAAILKTPESEVDKLRELAALAEEAGKALQADIAVFDQAVSTDAESLRNTQDQLQIQSIYDKLNQ
ncbi:MAG: hypothetical protein V1880_01910 [Patescibacteria group bacterium]